MTAASRPLASTASARTADAHKRGDRGIIGNGTTGRSGTIHGWCYGRPFGAAPSRIWCPPKSGHANGICHRPTLGPVPGVGIAGNARHGTKAGEQNEQGHPRRSHAGGSAIGRSTCRVGHECHACIQPCPRKCRAGAENGDLLRATWLRPGMAGAAPLGPASGFLGRRLSSRLPARLLLCLPARPLRLRAMRVLALFELVISRRPADFRGAAKPG